MTVPATAAPALYDVTVEHRRTQTLDSAFTHRMYLWCVDLDHLPRLPGPLRRLIEFRGADHLGRPDRSIRENLDAFLAARGIARPASVRMLAHPRTLGHVFNPITLYWCRAASTDGGPGPLVATVAEVHNTYGGRHHYLLDVDEQGRARVDKDFYVSPFFPVDGEYRMRVPEPGETLSATVVLRRPDPAGTGAGAAPGVPTTAFVATLRGRRRAATTRAVLAALARHPLVTRRVSLAIRRRGIGLWLRGLPVIARTPADLDRGVGQLESGRAHSSV